MAVPFHGEDPKQDQIQNAALLLLNSRGNLDTEFHGISALGEFSQATVLTVTKLWRLQVIHSYICSVYWSRVCS